MQAARPSLRTEAVALVLVMLALPMCSASAVAFRNLARPELQFPNVSSEVAALVAVHSTCVPPSMVLLSTTNEHHAPLRQLQFARVRDERCFMDRLLSVCFNVSDGHGTCVPGPRVHAAEFRKSNYANLIWAKWRILADALTAARSALWFDADVVLLRNPFASAALWERGGLDLRFQAELPPPVHNSSGAAAAWRRAAPQACPPLARLSGVNGGQLLLHSAALAHDMDRHRPPKLSNADFLDQDYANRLLVRAGYRRCPLPASFASQHWGRGTPPLEPCELHTFHTNGGGAVASKAALMRRWLARTAGCARVNASAVGGARREGRARPPPAQDGAAQLLDEAWAEAKYPLAAAAPRGHAAEWARFNQMFKPPV